MTLDCQLASAERKCLTILEINLQRGGSFILANPTATATLNNILARVDGRGGNGAHLRLRYVRSGWYVGFVLILSSLTSRARADTRFVSVPSFWAHWTVQIFYCHVIRLLSISLRISRSWIRVSASGARQTSVVSQSTRSHDLIPGIYSYTRIVFTCRPRIQVGRKILTEWSIFISNKVIGTRPSLQASPTSSRTQLAPSSFCRRNANLRFLIHVASSLANCALLP